MKKNIIATVIICLLMEIHVTAANENFHTFTDTKGRSIRAKLLKFEASTGRVFILTDSGNRTWMNPSALSYESAAYVRRWIQANQFLSENYLRVSINKRFIGDEICYDLTMENRTKNPLPSLKVDYVIYINRKGYNGTPDEMRCIGGTITIDNFAARKKVVKTTKEVSLEKQMRAAYTTGLNGTLTTDNMKIREDKPLGIWFKIYGPPLDGVRSVRDASFPNALKEHVVWAKHVFISQDTDLSPDVDSMSGLDSQLDNLNSMM